MQRKPLRLRAKRCLRAKPPPLIEVVVIDSDDSAELDADRHPAPSEQPLRSRRRSGPELRSCSTYGGRRNLPPLVPPSSSTTA